MRLDIDHLLRPPTNTAHLVGSFSHCTINIRKASFQHAFASKFDHSPLSVLRNSHRPVPLRKVDNTPKILLHLYVTTFTSSSSLADRGRIGYTELGLQTRLLVVSSSAGSLSVGLRADSVNFAHSSRVVTIFCSVFTIRRAFATHLTNYPLSFVVSRHKYSVSCNGYSLRHSDHCLRGCHSSHPHLHRSSLEHRLGLVSPSFRSSGQASDIYAFST